MEDQDPTSSDVRNKFLVIMPCITEFDVLYGIGWAIYRYIVMIAVSVNNRLAVSCWLAILKY